jgi:TRAP-type uncharacterized transport system substrate-binding protein
MLIAACGAIVLAAHTPYGQWTVYRQRNLFIVASQADALALELARKLVEGLVRELPEAHARVTRASNSVRIASLLATGQLDVAIVSRDEAADMYAGSGQFREIGPTPLRLLAELNGHILVTVESFRERHAFLLAQAVAHLKMMGSSLEPLSIPEHPGAAIYNRSKEEHQKGFSLR